MLLDFRVLSVGRLDDSFRVHERLRCSRNRPLSESVVRIYSQFRKELCMETASPVSEPEAPRERPSTRDEDS